jgi:hypothetical protein
MYLNIKINQKNALKGKVYPKGKIKKRLILEYFTNPKSTMPQIRSC